MRSSGAHDHGSAAAEGTKTGVGARSRARHDLPQLVHATAPAVIMPPPTPTGRRRATPRRTPRRSTSRAQYRTVRPVSSILLPTPARTPPADRPRALLRSAAATAWHLEHPSPTVDLCGPLMPYPQRRVPGPSPPQATIPVGLTIRCTAIRLKNLTAPPWPTTRSAARPRDPAPPTLLPVDSAGRRDPAADPPAPARRPAARRSTYRRTAANRGVSHFAS
jgi:hypothetical protein